MAMPANAAPHLRYERKPCFRIETPAGLSHGRNFFDLDISQISYLDP
jgi:hypothetical protein